jgi:hypothetical protein
MNVETLDWFWAIIFLIADRLYMSKIISPITNTFKFLNKLSLSK